ncbi:capsular polysaccharide synthesis protein [Bifidobacterium cuniculi]|uniref:Polysaccharide biosynthesis protein n=1 Tax=Bifidobacterium cuniculi TaxID=1688 RepID=A0A087AEW2_9BIFI|nr:capsular polysaccharide synthesis protein [Bifidobacterium cuniculi]KFI57312.1 polysaccharide biosynthesis protein [Bifidobacterium cuniculi]
MSIWQNIPQRLSKIASDARNATTLLGPKIAAEGVVYHCTHRMDAKYHRDFYDALWQRVMRPIIFDEAALTTLPATNDGPIWVAWWQGLDDQTPPVIVACIDSIRRHAGGREVIVVTRDNYAQYADIDPILVRRREEGTLTINAFCNALRVKLLYEHGGVWLDSTLYLTADLGPAFAELPFCSIHAEAHGQYPACHWTTYCLAAVKGNQLMKYIYDCFVVTFKRIAAVPEYFLFDAFFRNAYVHIPAVRAMMDCIPLSNTGRFDLSEQMDSTAAQPVLPADTTINKLTYKLKYPTQVDGKPTLYARVLDGTL